MKIKEFQHKPVKPDTYEASMALNQLMRIGKHAVKLHCTASGMVDKIFVYTANARETVEAFHVKDGRLIPFSDEELAKQ